MLIPYALTQKPQKAAHRGRSTLDADFDAKRMKLILDLRAQRCSLRDIGEQVNLSHERVRVLLAKAQKKAEAAASCAAVDDNVQPEE